MASSVGPRLKDNGLIFSVDGFNHKSFDSGSAPNDAINLVDTSQTGSLKVGTGFSNNAWDFDGTDDRIDFGVIPELNSLDVGSTFSTEAWIYVNNFSDDNFIIANGIANNIGASGSGWAIFIDDGTQRLTYQHRDFAVGIKNILAPAGAVTLNEWYHVASTYDGSNTASGMKQYVNGVLQASSIFADAATAAITSSNPILIGCLPGISNSAPYPSVSDFFDGQIASVNVYNKELTATEVLNNYEQTKWRFQ